MKIFSLKTALSPAGKAFGLALFLICLKIAATAQNGKILQLSDFNNPGPSWKTAAAVTAEYTSENFTGIQDGTGILVNQPTKKQKGADLYTKEEYGDFDLSLEYLIPKNSNSGIYLQGRYEIQIADSWGKQHISAFDNGGIYPSWDEKRGVGNESYDGSVPRINASRAPGLWQKLFISFQAAKFDNNGNKISNAKILKIELNGTLIHENIELMRPTRGAMSNNEVVKGPLRLQGDHGAVAFRNITVSNYYGQQPTFTDLKYSLYKGRFEFIPDYSEYEPEAEAKLDQLTTRFLTRADEFLIRYTGSVNIKQAGTYIFQRETNGAGYVKVNNQELSTLESYITKPIHLEAGTYPFEMGYTKPYNWFTTSFGLKVSSDNVREFLISDIKSLDRSFPDPVHIDPVAYPMMRSFIDLPNEKRLVHAISIGGADHLHYSYDLDNGALFQSWRGGFLDAANMWVGRGDGSSKALSTPVYFNNAELPVVKNNNDTTGKNFLHIGYETAKDQTTTFKYNAYGATVTDAIQLLESGKGLKRTISASNADSLLY
ncbi:MAG: DUF1080 domain-containing protein, partial [Chitinophagaceae bacterium]|nr:DUF1080 domain-containing protein [Chitinophagaceae bacterium]